MDLPRLKQHIENKVYKVLMTDFDGTLVPLGATPDSVHATDEVKRLLSDLSRKCLVTVISGRRLSDLRRLLPDRKLVLVGAHGAQIEWLDGSRTFAGGGEIDFFIQDLFNDLSKRCWRLPGIIIENKGCSLALHYRLATEHDRDHAVAMFRTQAEKALKTGDFTCLEGKKVVELVSNGTDKGQTACALLKHYGISKENALYIGDDVSDEFAFEALAPATTTILVSETAKKTQAEFCLNGPLEVFQFLQALLAAPNVLDSSMNQLPAPVSA